MSATEELKLEYETTESSYLNYLVFMICTTQVRFYTHLTSYHGNKACTLVMADAQS